MRRFLLISIALPLAVLLGWAALRMLESDESRIERLFSGLERCFNEQLPGDFAGLLDEEFRAQPYGIGTTGIRFGLSDWNDSHRSPQTGGLNYRVELPRHELVVSELDGDEGTARYVCVGAMFDVRREGAEPIWTFRIEGELKRHSWSWRVADATVETLGGRQPR